MPDDPVAMRSVWLTRFLTLYFRWMMARRFSALRLSRTGIPELPEGRSAIVYTNHPSWWDPAFFFVIGGRLFPGRRGYGPMDETALETKYALLKRIGVFSVSATPRGAARFLRVAQTVLADRRSMLFITAEGDFTDARHRPVALRPGLAHLARAIEGVVLVPLAVEYPFWNESRPEALARFGAPIVSSPGRSVAEWSEILTAELQRTMDTLAAESMARDAALFETLTLGTVGIGGPYDLWRWARSRLRGEQFDPSHEGRKP